MDSEETPRPPPALDRCGTCGERAASSARCPHCGSSLLVDVLVERPPGDPRLLYAVARAAASAGVPDLDFAAARARLERPGAPVGAALTRDGARALVAALGGAGCVAIVRPAVPPSPRRLSPATAGLALAAAGVLAGAILTVALRPGPAPVVPASAPAAPASAGGAVPARPAAPEASGSSPPAPEPREYTVEELARRARPALAVLTCGGKLGSGFFVSPERVLTNAHVTCGADVPLDVRIADGRQLVGRVRTLDAWLDYAVVEVPGARSPALPLGDSTALVAGSPVVLVGSPFGLEATVHAGKVSFAGRNLQGVAYLQVNADVNPGNSGGPLLDGRGRAVGIVTLKSEGAGGVGFALPVEYARAALDAPSGDEGADRRWAATVAQVEREDDADAVHLADRLEHGYLAGAVAAGTGLGVVVMRRWATSPPSLPITVEVRDGAKVLCEASGTISEWQPVEERFRAASDQDRATRMVRWMLRRNLAAGVFAGAVSLDVASCPEETSPWAAVFLRGGEESAAYPARELAEARRATQARARVSARLEEAVRTRSEAEWRDAFRTLRERIARLEDDRRLLRGAADRPWDAALADRARKELPGIERELARSREQLDELDRRASNAAVPREWRE